MTKIITRYYDSVAQARLVREELIYRQRLSVRIVHLYEAADGLADKLMKSSVNADTAKAYEKHVAKGGAVLLVQAGYKPLAVAKTTREVTAQFGAADMGGLIEEVEVEDALDTSFSVLTDHPLMLSKPHDPLATTHHMADG